MGVKNDKSMTNQHIPKNRTLAARLVIWLQTGIYWLAVYWLPLAVAVPAIIFLLAVLAPALLVDGWVGPAQTVYGWLAPHDHQLPQRSYFLFGQQGFIASYSREQVLAWGADPGNMRAFVGNPAIGFKMGLNHRMTAIFAASLLACLIWLARGGKPRLGPLAFILLALPLLIDGFSHMFSERSGAGFRAGNEWAAALTGGAFSAEFYSGTTIGTLNWWLRTITGALFGLGLTWFLLTYLSLRFAAIRRQLEPRLRRWGVLRNQGSQ
ncbi:MAG: hypothetical protein FOGNACKC_00687 [Anaerolineae bacterium]|nr:hypothetical protein [Anaerolineae bacterium]